jgi:hypothetical protein
MGDIWTRTNNVYKKVGELITRFGELETAASGSVSLGDDKGETGSNGADGEENTEKVPDNTENPDLTETGPKLTIKATGTYNNGYAAV